MVTHPDVVANVETAGFSVTANSRVTQVTRMFSFSTFREFFGDFRESDVRCEMHPHRCYQVRIFGSHKYVVVPKPERMSRDQAFSAFPASSIAMQTAGINQEHGIGDVTFSEEQAEQEELQEEQEEESEDPPVSEGQSEDTPEL